MNQPYRSPPGIAEFGEGRSLVWVQESIVIIGLAVATFVSTSVDNLFLLVGFLTNPGFRLRSIVVGYAGAVILVLCVGRPSPFSSLASASRYRLCGVVWHAG